MIRVMLVDDHALVRMGFRMLLADAQMEVVAEAENGEQACLDYPRVLPDVVVMDLSMPGMGGLEAVRRLLAQDPKARVLALSAHEDTAHPCIVGADLLAVIGFGHHLDVGVGQQHAKSHAHQRMVVDEHDADHAVLASAVATGAATGSGSRT